MRCACAILVLFASLPPVLAQAPAPALTDDNYRIDLNMGPVLGSTRVVGLAGAYAALAEKAVGIPFNPASVAHRPTYSSSGFDWDIALDWLSPGIFQGKDFDFDNNGRSLPTDLLAFTLGGDLQLKSFGFGAYFQGQRYRFRDFGSPARRFEATLGVLQVTGGYGFFGHQLIAGAGVRLGLLTIKERDVEGNSFSAQTSGLDLGLLLRVRDVPWRLGASLSVPVQEKVDTDPPAVPPPTSFYLPGKGVGIPLEFRIGGALCIGRRPFNALPDFLAGRLPPGPPADPAPGAPERGDVQLDGSYVETLFLTLTAELLVAGPVLDAVGTDGFLEQVDEVSGQKTTYSPRLGVEMEIWPGRLRVRGGSYWEPSRFEALEGRLHGTFGLELRVLDFKIFGAHGVTIAAAADFADRYSNVSVTLGLWH